METLSLLLGTVLLRPYVFIFLLMYAVVALHQVGWRRVLAWTVSGYLLAFLAEYSSIHCGFPFGDYYYIDTARSRELWLAGVPFMDSLSFTFLTFAGFSCAWQLVAAFRGRTETLDASRYQDTRRSWPVLFLGAAITTLMDLVIDPVALMGDRWFLGQIYGYGHTGFYFGIPMTNFGGWFLVSTVIIGVNQVLDRLFPEEPPLFKAAWLPRAHLGGFVLFLCIVLFNLVMAAWLGAYLLFLVSLCLVLTFLALSARVLRAGGLWLSAGSES